MFAVRCPWLSGCLEFRIFANMTPKAGVLIYDRDDEQTRLIALPIRPDVTYIGYGPHEHVVRDGQTFLTTKKDEEVPIQVFGEHNLRNISAAREVCKQLGIKGRDFYKAVASFPGAARRLELLAHGATSVVYKDFSHANASAERPELHLPLLGDERNRDRNQP